MVRWEYSKSRNFVNIESLTWKNIYPPECPKGGDEEEDRKGKMTLEEIEVWWNNKPEVDKLLKRPIFGHWEDVTNWLIQRVKELEEEKKGMVRLTEADMKKLGWSYT
jgi:hypothetical protein